MMRAVCIGRLCRAGSQGVWPAAVEKKDQCFAAGGHSVHGWRNGPSRRPNGWEEQRTGIRMATVAVQSGLQLYLKQINESPLLTAVQEKELARRIIEHNDPKAREIMVRSNLRLVVK